MKRILLLIGACFASCFLLIGCTTAHATTNESTIKKEETNNKNQFTDTNMEKIKKSLPKTERFSLDETSEFIPVRMKNTFSIKIKETYNPIIAENTEKGSYYNGILERLNAAGLTSIDHIQMLEYKYMVKEHDEYLTKPNELTLYQGEIEHNGLKWKYIVTDKTYTSDITFVYTDKDKNLDFIVNTRWVTKDQETILHNIRIALTELDLKILEN